MARLTDWKTKLFQSLLHQGISLLRLGSFLPGTDIVEFQSLLHQGISLLGPDGRPAGGHAAVVSIPSSSGHQFTVHHLNGKCSQELCFNPFFIRASVY